MQCLMWATEMSLRGTERQRGQKRQDDPSQAAASAKQLVHASNLCMFHIHGDQISSMWQLHMSCPYHSAVFKTLRGSI